NERELSGASAVHCAYKVRSSSPDHAHDKHQQKQGADSKPRLPGLCGPLRLCLIEGAIHTLI
ncbi:MAG TPA: hypothetical protein P5307_28040, partial [Pirellulaceae bacterium]|nr:hypothetical protein [Pirellulaceae bacterium]